ncbi:DUF1254 domain-containing protein [Subtercola lobariae]|uniref:DUF1254 domain-containing protein n=1 Tax=Subtercola lobariae TaxID=1588641 RepID=A0A917BJ74_9MICO|nr:DUF1254 domain-containing protein [Subtercola lobariae]GGF41760.1 hypothetical protein GCM10011399_38060 [Subtercola lobariae]
MSVDGVQAIAFEAYQYFYPLVTMDVTRKQATNVTGAGGEQGRAPVNRFAHFRHYPEAEARDVVRFNFDTLYSFAWLDVRDEPIVLTVPDSNGRFYLTPMLDMWTDVFAVPGTRTTQGQERLFAIAAPGWSGVLPDGVSLVHAPTPVVWVMGRTQCNGVDDYPTVHTIQDGLSTVPLSRWGTEFVWPDDQPIDTTVDDRTPPLYQVNAMSGIELLTYATELLLIHPAHPNDYPILERMRRIGVISGEVFDSTTRTAEEIDAINAGAAEALEDLIGSTTDGSLGVWRNGWMTIQGGTYATDYRRRAMVALGGLGCNLPEDALYPGTAIDDTGELLDGEHSYVLHFEAEELPPADAFWSLTMYDEEGFQVPNPIDRFAIGDRNPLAYNRDGSLDLLIQHPSPGDQRESNWLPAPSGRFQPMLRIYSPRPEALRRGVSLPAIRRVQ